MIRMRMLNPWIKDPCRRNFGERIWYSSPVKKARRILNWIRKSFEYSVFLWHDFDWDYDYIFRILAYKIRRTRECMVKNDISADTNRIARQMLVAEKLIARIRESAYTDKEWAEHYEKWPPGENDFKSTHNTPRGENVIRLCNLEITRRNRDMDFLFQHLRKYIGSWWD